MNICLVGNSLTNLVLANILVSRKIRVDLYFTSKKLKKFKDGTLGISEKNINFLKENAITLEKIIWPIKKIGIYNEKNLKKNILEFSNGNRNCFSILKNDDLYQILKKKLKKNYFFKQKQIKNKFILSNVLNEYDLVINSEQNNYLSKKYFSKRFFKDYQSDAYTTTISHQKCNNKTAIQIFTKYGPLAFLPISENKTSIVFSVFKNQNLDKQKIINLIKNYNLNYKIYNLSELSKFKLKFSLLKKYFKNNLLAFGDCLHQIHPLAGQGFNMSLRDIETLVKIIDERIGLGLEMDSSISEKFEKKTKSSNFIFSSGIDFIHEFFKFDNKLKNNFSKKIFDLLRNKSSFNKYIKIFADKGLTY